MGEVSLLQMLVHPAPKCLFSDVREICFLVLVLEYYGKTKSDALRGRTSF